MRRWLIAEGWEVKERNTGVELMEDFASQDGWTPAQVPGTVHEALLAAGAIPDPYFGRNELAVQWIGERDWLFRCRFELPLDEAESDHTIDLCCDGLDTIATVWLNGVQVGASDNMFVPQRMPIADVLTAGTNTIGMLFESALRVGKAREAKHGRAEVWNGDPSRVYVRKAQYHYGWDWGPCLLTAGPWKDVAVEAYRQRIDDIHVRSTLADDLSHAELAVEVTTQGVALSATARIELFGPDGASIQHIELPLEATRGAATLTVAAPQVWWPRGYGAQARYRLVTQLLADNRELDRRELRIGLRRVRLIQAPLPHEPGTSFVFEVNDTEMFCGGANWIPADALQTRVSDDWYRTLIELSAEANLVMLRVWAGGIYEADAFYELCDEHGILVWQDFLFACGLYPAHDQFMVSVAAEARAAIRRLRHHPSLVIWCGNNEDYSLAESVGALAERFPARAIYEDLLPSICNELDPDRLYWPGSPSGGAWSDDPTVGDRHTWEIWHRAMAPYAEYPRFAGRFVSEFGMQSAPHRTTIEAVLPPGERHPSSRTFEHHNKAEGGPRRLAAYLSDTLRLPATLTEYVYATQFVQSEALAAAYRGWRRSWRVPGERAVAGALVWQLNDCWPVTSWAIIDHACRPKPAYYVIRRELAPVTINVSHALDGAELWVVNGTATAIEAVVEISQWTLGGQQLASERRRVGLAAKAVTELGSLPRASAEHVVIGARLLVGDDVVARSVLWPEPFKYFTLGDPELAIERDGEVLRLRVARPAKGVWLDAGPEVRWSDNMLDLLPDESYTIGARGLRDQAIDMERLK